MCQFLHGSVTCGDCFLSSSLAILFIFSSLVLTLPLQYILAQNDTSMKEVVQQLGEKEYPDIDLRHRVALLEYLCNEFMTKSVAFR